MVPAGPYETDQPVPERRRADLKLYPEEDAQGACHKKSFPLPLRGREAVDWIRLNWIRLSLPKAYEADGGLLTIVGVMKTSSSVTLLARFLEPKR